jgi:uncharacterized membrane protein YgaE (UPF0421/DUF939 family)
MDGEGVTNPSAARVALFQGLGTSLVAMFCYVTASLVPGLSEAYWAPIAAVVVLYPETSATRKASGDRFLGTIFGSLIGWASAVLWHQNVLLYGISIFLAVGVCYLLRRENASRLCAVAVTVITLIPRSEPAHVVAFHRFIEVTYGVACAVLYTSVADAVRGRATTKH